MNNEVFSESVETIEQILRSYHNDDFLNVKEINCQAGSKEGGENFVPKIDLKISNYFC